MVLKYNPRPFVPMWIGYPMARNNDLHQSAKVCSVLLEGVCLGEHPNSAHEKSH